MTKAQLSRGLIVFAKCSVEMKRIYSPDNISEEKKMSKERSRSFGEQGAPSPRPTRHQVMGNVFN